MSPVHQDNFSDFLTILSPGKEAIGINLNKSAFQPAWAACFLTSSTTAVYLAS